MTTETTFDITLHWPEMDPFEDEEEEEQFNEWMENKKFRRLLYAFRLLYGVLMIGITSIVTLLALWTLYTVVPGLPQQPEVLFWVALSIALGVMVLEGIVGGYYKPPISHGAGSVIYVTFVCVYHIRQWYKSRHTMNPSLSEDVFAEMLEVSPLYYYYQRDSGRNWF